MIVQEIIDRLRETLTPAPFRIIEGAAELAEISGAPPKARPALYVLTAEEASEENEHATGTFRQLTLADIAVVIVTGNVSDPRGAAAAADIEALKVAVRTRLIGWEPASAEEPISHVAGKLTQARAGAVWWEETFATAYYQEA